MLFHFRNNVVSVAGLKPANVCAAQWPSQDEASTKEAAKDHMRFVITFK